MAAAERGTIPVDKRKTSTVKTDTADKIDTIDYCDRQSVKEVVDDAFNAKIARYEKKNGPVKPQPKK